MTLIYFPAVNINYFFEPPTENKMELQLRKEFLEERNPPNEESLAIDVHWSLKRT